MDSNEETTRAQQIDPKMVGSIIRNIADLERNFRLADGPIGDQLLAEIIGIIRGAAPAPWETATTAWSALLTCPDWKPTLKLGRGDAWLEVVEMAEDDQDHTWIAAALGAGPTKMALELIGPDPSW